MKSTLHHKPPRTAIGARGGIAIALVMALAMALAAPISAQTGLPPCSPGGPFICDDSGTANEDLYTLVDSRPALTAEVEEGTQGEIGDFSRNTRATVEYWLSGDDADQFTIDADGVVSNVRDFDYSVDREFNFNVVARVVFARYEDFNISRAVRVTVAGAGTIPPPLPESPQRLRTSSTANSITLEWDNPDDNTISGYQVLRKPLGCGCPLQVYVDNTGNADTTYTDTSVVTGKWYVYRVKAINETGIGPHSNYVRQPANVVWGSWER